ncbi:MAG: hypothetical protein AB7O26_15550 [Planctomycetaceae bacterium]
MKSHRFKIRATARGMSMTEVVLSTILVALVVVGALNGVAGVMAGHASLSNVARANKLAAELLAEVLEQPYADPNETPVFGPESSESTSSRTDFDDVDDYDGWTATPPKSRTGTTLTGFDGWERKVVVKWVTPNDPSVISGTDQGVKRITVTVSRNGVVIATQIGLRTDKF